LELKQGIKHDMKNFHTKAQRHRVVIRKLFLFIINNLLRIKIKLVEDQTISNNNFVFFVPLCLRENSSFHISLTFRQLEINHFFLYSLGYGNFKTEVLELI